MICVGFTTENELENEEMLNDERKKKSLGLDEEANEAEFYGSDS